MKNLKQISAVRQGSVIHFTVIAINPKQGYNVYKDNRGIYLPV